MSVLILLVALGSPAASLAFKLAAAIATAVTIPGYLWMRRRIGSSNIAAIHENGFRFKSRVIAWSNIKDATHGRVGMLDILTVRMAQGTPVEIHGHVYGSDLPDDIVAALRSRKIKVFDQGR